MKLSVIIIAKNEEERIRTCLESVKWVSEIIVADNGSLDKTVDIAKEYTENVFTYKNLNFADLRNKASEKASGDWILYIDPDERVLADLKNEIQEMIGDDRFSAYAISRRNIIFGKEKKYGPFWPDWVIRLIKRSDFKSWIGDVHEYPKYNGKLSYSKNSLLHLTHRNIDQVILKSLEWSKIDANLRIKSNHPKMSGWRFLRIFITETFNQGILRKGFFNGTIGIMDSILQAFSMYITYVRLWEMQQSEPLDGIYNDIDKLLKEKDFRY